MNFKSDPTKLMSYGNSNTAFLKTNEQDPQTWDPNVSTTAAEIQRDLHKTLYMAAYNIFVFITEKLETSRSPPWGD